MVEQIHTALLTAGAGIQTPKRIVVHAMAEYIIYQGKSMHAVSFLKNVGLSAHVLVTPSGVRIRCRDDNKGAFHAKGFNTNSLGIEFLVPGVHDYGSFINTINHEDYLATPAYFAGVKQCREWVEKYSIDIMDRHSDLDPERKDDPGGMFPWEAFTEAVFDS